MKTNSTLNSTKEQKMQTRMIEIHVTKSYYTEDEQRQNKVFENPNKTDNP